MSRIQPWWGGSLVPFVDQANHHREPHLEFRLRRGQVSARALRVIEPGEVFQSYGELSTADSLYRYGFTEPAGRAADIGVSFADVVTIDASALAAAEEHLAERAEQLKALEFLEESPWDGLQDLGVELSLSRRPKAAAGGIKGLRRLWAICSCAMLNDTIWREALATAKPKEALVALGASPKPGVDWQPDSSALKLCIRALEARSRRLGSVEEEERSYDVAVKDQVETIHLGLQRLRVVEARLLERVLHYVRGLVHAQAGEARFGAPHR